MSNKTLQELILKNVVIHYIETPEPIGSSQLKESLDLNVSPATIRNYFKKLVAEGYLDQLHSSSGRIPTSMAFKEFWHSQLEKQSTVYIEDERVLADASKFFGLFTIVRVESRNKLLDVYNIENKFLLLHFEDGELTLQYERLLEAFLTQFNGYDLIDLLKISVDNRVDLLTVKLSELVRSKLYTYNNSELISLARDNQVWGDTHFDEYYKGDVINEVENGIYFEHYAPKDHMLVKKSGYVGDVPISIMILGHMSRDFNRFFNSI